MVFNASTFDFYNSRPKLKESQIGILKGVYGIIPFIGTIINEILFDIPNRINQTRINDTVEILKEKVLQIDNRQIFDLQLFNSLSRLMDSNEWG